MNFLHTIAIVGLLLTASNASCKPPWLRKPTGNNKEKYVDPYDRPLTANWAFQESSRKSDEKLRAFKVKPAEREAAHSKPTYITEEPLDEIPPHRIEPDESYLDIHNKTRLDDEIRLKRPGYNTERPDHISGTRPSWTGDPEIRDALQYTSAWDRPAKPHTPPPPKSPRSGAESDSSTSASEGDGSSQQRSRRPFFRPRPPSTPYPAASATPRPPSEPHPSELMVPRPPSYPHPDDFALPPPPHNP